MDNDLISRKAFEKWAQEFWTWGDKKQLVSAIRNAPVVEAVLVVHGRWEEVPIHLPNDTYGMNKYNLRIKCTACGFVTSSDYNGFKHCQCCGAKMDLKES